MKVFAKLFFLLFLLSGCLYPRVNVTKQQKRLVSNYKNQKPTVFYSNTGLTDTVEFKNYGYIGNYKTNLDVFWEIMVNERTNKNREFYCSVIATSGFKADKYNDKNLNIYLGITLTKSNNADSLILTLNGFEEKYVIDKKSSDTLVFQNLRNKKECKTSCLNKIYFSVSRGIVSIEKSDGSVWKVDKIASPFWILKN